MNQNAKCIQQLQPDLSQRTEECESQKRLAAQHGRTQGSSVAWATTHPLDISPSSLIFHHVWGVRAQGQNAHSAASSREEKCPFPKGYIQCMVLPNFGVPSLENDLV